MSDKGTPTSSPPKKKKSNLFRSTSTLLSGVKSKIKNLRLVGDVDESRKKQASSDENASDVDMVSGTDNENPTSTGDDSHVEQPSSDVADDDTEDEDVIEEDKPGPSNKQRTKNLVHSKTYLPNREDPYVGLSASESFQSAEEKGDEDEEAEVNTGEDDEESDDSMRSKKSKRQQ